MSSDVRKVGPMRRPPTGKVREPRGSYGARPTDGPSSGDARWPNMVASLMRGMPATAAELAANGDPRAVPRAQLADALAFAELHDLAARDKGKRYGVTEKGAAFLQAHSPARGPDCVCWFCVEQAGTRADVAKMMGRKALT